MGVNEAVDNSQIEHSCVREEIYYLLGNVHGDDGGGLKNITVNL